MYYIIKLNSIVNGQKKVLYLEQLVWRSNREFSLSETMNRIVLCVTDDRKKAASLLEDEAKRFAAFISTYPNKAKAIKK